MAELTARIHSVETLGAVDGPGIRFVIFFQGCPLRCLYCHNPDTWNPEEGRTVTVGELMAEAGRYRSYMRASGGGVTASGGEPLLQAEFIAAFFERCREKGIHTAVDTSGCINLTQSAPA
jgi:pyruvate formate lyase activating enzyme